MDAKELVKKLCDHYGSEDKVADATGLAQSTINRIRRGLNSPNWATYQTLLSHWMQISESAA